MSIQKHTTSCGTPQNMGSRRSLLLPITSVELKVQMISMVIIPFTKLINTSKIIFLILNIIILIPKVAKK